MGSIPMLIMMIAATGVTYGWQPDPNGDDASSVQYIVQVSPHEFARMQQIGEVTTVIAPEVREHVSRIVVRVGSGDPPRELPTMLRRSIRVAARKPDPQSGGMSLPPSLRDSMSQAGDSARNAFTNQVDQAGRSLGNQAKGYLHNALGGATNNQRANNQQANDQRDRAVVSPPSTRLRSAGPSTSNSSSSVFGGKSPATSFPAPGFASQSTRSQSTRSGRDVGLVTPGVSRGGMPSDPRGSATGYAQTPTRGPSTSETSRSKDWRGFGSGDNRRVSVTTASNTSGRFIDPPSTAKAAPTSSNPSNTGRLASNGLRSSDLFGRTPGASPMNGSLGKNDDQATTHNTTGYSAEDRWRQPMSQQDQVLLDRQQQSSRGSGLASRSPNLSGVRPLGTRSSNTEREYGNERQSDRSYRDARSRTPKRELTRAQAAAGGDAFDANGRLVDRDGRLIRDPELDRGIDRSLNNSENRSAYSATPTRIGPERPLTEDERAGYRSDAQDGLDGYRDRLSSRDDDLRFANSPTSRRSAPSRYDERDTRRSRFDEDVFERYDDSRSRYTGASPSASRRWRDEELDARYPQRDTRTQDIRRSLPDPVVGTASVAGTNREPSPSSRELTTTPIQTAQILPGLPGNSRGRQNTPMFTTLLMTSIFVNLFFLYWLHNLRQRFRSIVVAKRMVESTATAS